MFVEEKREGEVIDQLLEPWRQWCLDAAQYIRDHGWCQAQECDSCGRVCMVGALRQTDRFSDPGKEHWKTIDRVFNRVLLWQESKQFPCTFINYNDCCERLESEVVGMLEKMAKEG